MRSLISSLASVMTTSCFSLQPPFSGVPASSGQLSRRSTTVSPSRSLSGQPLFARGPGSFLQEPPGPSLSSAKPSLSLSKSGQPSPSSNSSLSSGTSLHLSSPSLTPSLSLSSSGQPSVSSKPSLSSGCLRHAPPAPSVASGMPSLSSSSGQPS